VASVTKAWTDKTAIKDAEKGVVDNLAYENLWSMYFLEAQLNQIKYQKASTGKSKILILGDSITAGMGITYTGKQANAEVENAWWQSIDASRNEVMFLAVGGIGVIQQGLVNNVASDSGFDMLKYAEKVSTMGKDYDKIVIALSTNDYNYSDAEYSKALSQMMDYLKSNYKSKQYIFLNFYKHKDAMKEVAKKYSAKYIDVDMTKIDKYNSKIDNTHPSAKGQKQIYELIKSNF
jgi:lysophospholipase L1-like esterase